VSEVTVFSNGVLSAPIGTNVSQIDVRRAFETSSVYMHKCLFKDTCLLVSRKKKSAKRPLKLYANDDRVRPLTFICCYKL